MSATPVEPTPTPDPAPEPPTPQEPAAAAPTDPATPAKKSLEDNLASLDDDARAFVLGEVTKARNEAKNLRDRLKEAEPRLSEYDKLVEASKTDLERAQEAARVAGERATGMLRDVATAKIEAALTGVIPDVAGFIEDLNVDKFIKDDAIDADAITALRTKYAAFAPPEKPGMKPNPAQGASASPSPTLQDQIAQAQEAGDIKSAIRLKSRQALDASDN